jgi:hypothetical protein
MNFTGNTHSANEIKNQVLIEWACSPKNANLNVKIPSELKEEFRRICDNNGMTLSEAVASVVTNIIILSRQDVKLRDAPIQVQIPLSLEGWGNLSAIKSKSNHYPLPKVG